MLYTVSTVKDTTANIETFIQRNLAAGADHLLIFLDDADPAQAEALAGAHVTVVPTGPAYWQGRRADSLNRRQGTNADLANLLLSALPWADWLFHIDGDECLHIDKSHLSGLAPKKKVVRLRPLEAVARPEWPGEVTHFKRPLTKRELALVHERGLIDEPSNSAYFRGHVMGKAGVRPSPLLCVGIHHATTQHGAQLRDYTDDALWLLHYESHTGEEFVRKWSNLLGSHQRQKRRSGHVAEQIQPIVDSGAEPDEKSSRLWKVFLSSRVDDLEALDELGLLVTPDPAWHHHQPLAHTTEQAEQLGTLLELLLGADRRYVDRYVRRFQPVTLLADLARQQRDAGRADLAALLHGALTRH